MIYGSVALGMALIGLATGGSLSFSSELFVIPLVVMLAIYPWREERKSPL